MFIILSPLSVPTGINPQVLDRKIVFKTGSLTLNLLTAISLIKLTECFPNCDGARARHLPNSAKFCQPVIGPLITSALATLTGYLFTLPPVHTSSSSF